MRRIFHNSTAIALCLSMGLPQLAFAETFPAAGKTDGAGNIRLAQAEDAPVILPRPVPAAPQADAAAEATDEARGAEDAAATKADRQPAPAAEPDQPEPAASEAAEAPQDKGDSAAPQGRPETDAAPAGTPSDADIAKALAERAAAEPAAAPDATAEPAATAEPDATAAEPAPAPVEPETPPAPVTEDRAPEIPAATPTEPAGADTAAPAADRAEEIPPPAADRADELPPALPENEAAKVTPAPAATPESAPSNDAIAKALAEREAAGASDADAAQPEATSPQPVPPKEADKAKTGATTLATDKAEVTTPETAQTPPGDDLAAALAAAQAVPEAAAPETAAAREAAQEASAPPVAALLDSSDPVAATETTEVTEKNSRSATEDFITDIKGAVRQGTGVPVVGGQAQDGQATVTPAPTETAEGKTESRKRDRTDDLLGVALPALAGLIAGQMLSNNRQVTLNTGDRVVVTRPDGSQEIIKDDNALLQRPGSTVQTQEFADGSSRTVVAREDGSQVVTIRDRDLRVLRRTLVNPDGTTVALIDDTAQVQPVVVSQLPPPARPVTVAPGQRLSEADLRDALRREVDVNRAFSLGQIRNIPEVRALVAPIDIQAITFETGSAAIKSDQAQNLAALGRVIAEFVRANPREVFMVEGYTDTVGSDAANLALSDRRAESVALALSEFFGVPPENMVVQGYGERFLKVPAEGDIRENRRAAVRRITDLLARN